MEAITTKKVGSLTVAMYYDDNPINPRLEWDNLGRMVCFHNRHDLGDEQSEYRKGDFDSWDELHDMILADNPGAEILPLRIYDHGGVSISTSDSYPYNCGWDSSMVGFIYISREDMVKEFGKQLCTKFVREKARRCLTQEVATYDECLRGEVYGWIVTDNDGEVIDSCWGYVGDEDYVMSEGISVAEHHWDIMKRELVEKIA